MIHAIPLFQKQKINDVLINSKTNYIVQYHYSDHYKKHWSDCIRKTWDIHVQCHFYRQTIQQPLKKCDIALRNEKLDRNQIFTFPWIVSINNFQRSFRYKILQMILYLNKMHFTFCKTKVTLRHSWDETTKHIFLECICVKKLLNHSRLFLTNYISLPILTPKTTIFCFIIF